MTSLVDDEDDEDDDEDDDDDDDDEDAAEKRGRSCAHRIGADCQHSWPAKK